MASTAVGVFGILFDAVSTLFVFSRFGSAAAELDPLIIPLLRWDSIPFLTLTAIEITALIWCGHLIYIRRKRLVYLFSLFGIGLGVWRGIAGVHNALLFLAYPTA